MIKEAIDRILALGKTEVVAAQPGQLVTDKTVMVMAPEPKVLGLNTLSGIVDYVVKNVEDAKGCFVHVSDFDKVHLYLQRRGDTEQRVELLRASAEHCMNRYKFGHKYNVEEFIIALQSSFVVDETVKQILSIVSSMKAEKVTTADDDGLTQQVTARAGVVMAKQIAIPNPVVLAPYRTFPEIKQPESMYVFRVHQNGSELPSVSLTATESSQWKIDAIAEISKYLSDGLKDAVKIIS